MKTVFSAGELPHVWVQQSQSSGRTPNNSLFFRDSIIFSYGEHFPLAKLVTLPSGEVIALINNNDTTPTTNRHRSSVRRAVSHLRSFDVYTCVYDINFKEELRQWGLYFETYRLKIARAKKNQAYYVEMYVHYLTRFIAFAKNILPHIVTDYDEVYVDTFLESMMLPPMDTLKQQTQVQINKQREEAKARKAAQQAEFETKLSNWKKGMLHAKTPVGNYTYLRCLDGETIETSKHIKIPKRQFEAFYKAYKKGKATGLKVKSNNGVDYTIQTVTSSIVKSGCHIIPVEEIEYIADLLKNRGE